MSDKKAKRILIALRDGERHGADLQRATKMLAGTFYPLILKLETMGIVKSEWEILEPHEASRPPPPVLFTHR